ncbi:MAG TPA: photosynthetic reaction center cytochrome c subunit family protein [Fimbriimonas sp.]|nr:photosynthetic reaction center cytochrome c subunit family protein [Fimbriimonas sp.]
MRLAYVLSVLSCTVFGSAVAMTIRQDQPLAEQQFKNIRSFKGEKASDVVPAMEFMSASLKVECDFCHTEDRASDAKGEKVTAREMIAMQRDINKNHFGGRNVVTCATCHNGHPHPINVPPVEGLDARPRRSQDVPVEQVLAAYGKASGEDASHPIEGLQLRGTSLEHGEKSGFEATYMGKNYYFLTHASKGDQKTGFNGSMLWFTLPNGVQRVPLQYAEQFANQSALLYGPSTLPKLDNPSGATAKIAGRDMLVVSGFIAGEKTRLSIYFDKQTGLLTRTMFSYPTILGNIVQTNDFSDYRKVGGVQIPMTVSSHSAEGDTVHRFTSAKVEKKIDPAIFDPAK